MNRVREFSNRPFVSSNSTTFLQILNYKTISGLLKDIFKNDIDYMNN